MQEEVENRTVNLAVTTTKLSARTLISAGKKLLETYGKSRNRKSAEKSAKANVKPTGKQTVKELIGQNQGVSSIDMSKTDLRGFEKYAGKYGVDYAVRKDSSVQPPKYIIFFKARDADALTAAFKEYTSDVMKNRSNRKSVLKELKKYKAIAAAIPGKVRDKIREQVR